MMHKYFIFILSLLSLLFLIPGIYLDVYSIALESSVDVGVSQFDLNNFHKSRSILKMIQELWNHHDYLVATLIALFSIGIPFLKFVLLQVCLFSKTSKRRDILKIILTHIGKWSMADVFVVAIFLVFLASREQFMGAEKELSFFMVKLNVKLKTYMTSSLENGFYFFLGYCLLSLFSHTLFSFSNNKK